MEAHDKGQDEGISTRDHQSGRGKTASETVTLKYKRGPALGLEADIPDITLFHDPSADREVFPAPASSRGISRFLQPSG